MTLAAAASAVAMSANAAVDIFAKIGDIKGESFDKDNKDNMDVVAWSWGVAGARKKTVACGFEMTIDKNVDLASPKLAESAARGQVHPTAWLKVRKSGENPLEFLVITMKDVIVTSVAPGGASSLDRQPETITLSYASATITYTPQDPKGTGGAPVTGLVPASCPP